MPLRVVDFGDICETCLDLIEFTSQLFVLLLRLGAGIPLGGKDGPALCKLPFKAFAVTFGRGETPLEVRNEVHPHRQIRFRGILSDAVAVMRDPLFECVLQRSDRGLT